MIWTHSLLKLPDASQSCPLLLADVPMASVPPQLVTEVLSAVTYSRRARLPLKRDESINMVVSFVEYSVLRYSIILVRLMLNLESIPGMPDRRQKYTYHKHSQVYI